jgi:endonuclease/exonuclease/phosphatase (EEP) superfamily protein YafD
MSRWRPIVSEVVGWLVVASVGLVVVTQWFATGDSKALALLHSFTPFFLLAPFPLMFVATIANRPAMATVAALQGVASLVLVAPVVFPDGPSAAPSNAPRLTIAHANMLYSNSDADGATRALAATDADVLVMTEFTPLQQRELDAAVGDAYPFRVDAALNGTEGVGLWSRFPLKDAEAAPIDLRRAVTATVVVDGAEIRVIGVHPIPPFSDLGQRHWKSSLDAIHEAGAAPGPPTVIVGDFNASRWHPVFRSLLDQGWTDAHEATGRGFSVSWPIDASPIPAFIRLDHALTDSRLTALDTTDFDTPGSDHRGFTVTVAVTPPG